MFETSCGHENEAPPRNSEKLCRRCNAKRQQNAWKAKNKEKVAKGIADWQKINKDKISLNCARYYQKHTASIKARQSKWLKNNRPKATALTAFYRAQKRKATPPWLTEEHLRDIKEIYKTCPPGYHVDHIEPIKGKEVCGLHVPWNLQHLPAEENIRKGNRRYG